jgi:hypothetical protein
MKSKIVESNNSGLTSDTLLYIAAVTEEKAKSLFTVTGLRGGKLNRDFPYKRLKYLLEINSINVPINPPTLTFPFLKHMFIFV